MKRKLIQGEKAYIQMPVEVKSIDKDLGTLEAIFSTQDVDRHGDVVLQEGWDLVNFKKNPVILNSHNYGDAAEVIGKASQVKIDGKKLVGKITFAVNENPKAKVIFDLYAGGFLNAFSVGFIPTKFKDNKDGTKDWYTIEEAELLEVSAVSVPANARALAKAKGIDIDVLPTTKDNEHDEPKPEDTEETPEGDSVEIPKDDEVSPTDGEAPAGDIDGGESEPDGGDEKPDGDAGGAAGGETVPDEGDGVTPPAPTEAPVQASYAAKVAKAITHIESKEKAQYRKVANILDSLLNGEESGVRMDSRTREQVRKRKTNQAIRMLLKIK